MEPRTNSQAVPLAVGVDVGGTKIHAGVINRQGDVIAEYYLPTLAHQQDVISRIIDAIDCVVQKAGAEFQGTLSIGCLELYASGTGIARMMQELQERNRIAGSPIPLESKEIVSRWLQVDPDSTQIMDEVIMALGTGISSLIHILNPDAIVIGGGVAEIGEPLFAPLRAEVAKRTMSSLHKDVWIGPVCMRNRSGMIGAGLQAWEYESFSL